MIKEKMRLLIEEAVKWIGTHEIGGENRGPDIERFQRAVDGKAQGEPWCLAFVQFCVKTVDSKFETGHAGPNPPSALAATEHCMTLWNNTPKQARLSEPVPGCLVIWQFWKDGKPTTQGHVGIVVSAAGTSFETVEGNTSPSGDQINREGDCVARKSRLRHPLGSMRVVGFIQPWISE